jgi:dTDP-4-dehydrorhamnose reductase
VRVAPSAILPTRPEPRPLELWGGIECTVNRVGDAYYDQLEVSGHARRPEDLERIAALGVRALRYPVLWERLAPDGPERADWTWADERLGRLRALGVTPIVGLVHHGSGPRRTGLVDGAFPEGLAAFARAVAERYPWVDAYTPVNEPLTTARFSGLYGHWYPHGRDELTFARAFLTQCRAVVLAMRAIRQVTPRARLVQTEDLGKTYATRPLAHQADFENERRWLTWDLLGGRVRRGHRMWHHLTWAGIPEAELAWFEAHACPPDVVGVNHYVTSERLLDHRTDRYPPATHGGNGRQRYADVEAVRALAACPAGPAALLREAWERYGLPVAVTEAHLAGTREEQLRWLLDVWRGAQEARQAGARVLAVTAWSLLGACDWDSLVTRPAGHYEPGAFDLRGPRPRPTALARLLPVLAMGGVPSHPVLDSPGWWRRPDKRLLYPPVRAPWSPVAPAARGAASSRPGRPAAPSPIVILGADSALGEAFVRLCDDRGLAHRWFVRGELDLADPAADAVLGRLRPWAVVNAAGYTRIDQAERAPGACYRENVQAPAALAAACARRGVRLAAFSSDLVFDGAKGAPYVERDRPAPLSVYGRSLAEGEARVLAALPRALVVRSGPLFGPWDTHNFVTTALRRLAGGLPFTAAADTVVSPTYVTDLAHACLDLLIDGEGGVWHLANGGTVTWLQLAERAAAVAGVEVECLEGLPTDGIPLRAARPPYSALGSERGQLLPPLDAALERYVCDCRAAGTLGTPARPPRPRRRPGGRSSDAAA